MMRTVINIGCNLGAVSAEFEKPFAEITYTDVFRAASKHFDYNPQMRVQGWANVTSNKNKKT